MISDEIAAYIGMSSTPDQACDPVEAGAVRRYVQAIMDPDPVYGAPSEHNARFGGPVAPPLYPNHMLRSPLGSPDPFAAHAGDDDFDGLVLPSSLPKIAPFAKLAVLNGGSEFEFFRYAGHGEHVTVTETYLDVTAKESRKGLMYLVKIQSDFQGEDGTLIMRAVRTQIRR